MKKTIILLLMTLSIISCEKDDPSKPSEPIAEIDKLPPATQIGANKAGCLVDGKALTPGYYNNSTNCFYQYVNGKYYFIITFDNRYNNIFKSIIVGTGLQIVGNQTLSLLERIDGNAFGIYTQDINNNYTSHTRTGELKITKLDPINYIVSGTFWFDVVDKEGVVHQIREGRFDMQYTN